MISDAGPEEKLPVATYKVLWHGRDAGRILVRMADETSVELQGYVRSGNSFKPLTPGLFPTWTTSNSVLQKLNEVAKAIHVSFERVQRVREMLRIVTDNGPHFQLAWPSPDEMCYPKEGRQGE